MIRRKSDTGANTSDKTARRNVPRSFDDFDLKLGDMLRGERATLGKSLLDVQRELKIRANYIAAIENSDPSAFETPGFIAGYVRSYARYLRLDPDETFAKFCQESGFSVAHGMSDEASSIRKPSEPRVFVKPVQRDPFGEKNLVFVPKSESVLSKIEPAAIGSSLVLLALLAGVGYGGWAVLQEVQRVQVTPVDQTPQALSDIASVGVDEAADSSVAGVFTPPRDAALDRLYRPQALDVPVLVARDAPISTLDPSTTGLYAQYQRTRLPVLDEERDAETRAQSASQTAGLPGSGFSPFVPGSSEAVAFNADGQSAVMPASLDGLTPDALAALPVRLFASDAVWFKATGADGKVLASETLDSGAVWTPPANAQNISVGTSRPYALFALVGDKVYGPIGQGVEWTSVKLDPATIVEGLTSPSKGENANLDRAIAKAGDAISVPAAPATPAATPQVYADGAPAISITSKRRVWMRVTSTSGAIIKDFFLEPGESYTLPQLAQAPKLRVGDAGAVYFTVGDATYGPMGSNGSPENFENLTVAGLQSEFAPVDIGDVQAEQTDTAVAEAIAAQSGED